MKFKSLLFLGLATFSVGVFSHTYPGAKDHYKTFSELIQFNAKGADYDIEIQERDSTVLVMAIHGGVVEPGTTELGRELTKERYKFYSFIGLRGELNPWSLTSSELHLTSAKYDDPKLSTMAESSEFCLSLHGFGGKESDFCVGGANEEKRAELTKILSRSFPELSSCDLCCPPYNGTSLKNPVNHCQRAGVQIEMSPRVRRMITQNPQFKEDVAKALQSGLLDIP